MRVQNIRKILIADLKKIDKAAGEENAADELGSLCTRAGFI